MPKRRTFCNKAEVNFLHTPLKGITSRFPRKETGSVGGEKECRLVQLPLRNVEARNGPRMFSNTTKQRTTQVAGGCPAFCSQSENTMDMMEYHRSCVSKQSDPCKFRGKKKQ